MEHFVDVLMISDDGMPKETPLQHHMPVYTYCDHKLLS